MSRVSPDSPKKTLSLNKANSLCHILESFKFSCFDSGFNIVIFKKPKDPKINHYLQMTLEVVVQSLSRNGIAPASIRIYMDREALADLEAMVSHPSRHFGYDIVSTVGLDLETLPPA